jgi:tRNA pseudouridine38-40 synthase
MRIAIGIEYDGSAFQGWQTQPSGNTVQDAVSRAIAEIAGVPVDVVAAGRTDAGVHATGQTAHFDVSVKRPLTAWVRGVNSFLPGTVAVRWAQPVSDEFHARFSAYGRAYRYLLINRPQRPGLWHDRAGWYHQPLDVERMRQAAAVLVGEHDFSSFRAADCQAKSPVKDLRRVDVNRSGDMIVFDLEAGAFLHHMVRNIVGSLVHVGRGEGDAEWMRGLLAAKKRSLAPPTFAAAGLYLVDVSYEAHWGLPGTRDSFLPAAEER